MIGLKPPSCTEKIWLETTEGRFFSLGIPRCLMMFDDVEKVIHLLSCSFMLRMFQMFRMFQYAVDRRGPFDQRKSENDPPSGR
jgi:hypothetical protein